MNTAISPEIDRHTRMLWKMLFFLVPIDHLVYDRTEVSILMGQHAAAADSQ